MADTVFIYTINCPVSGLVKYVGKTVDTKMRFRKHLSETGRTKKHRWVKGLKNKGLSPIFDVIDECGVNEWEAKERGYISLFRAVGAELLNEMPGGEGGPTMTGKKLTATQIKKISDSKIGKARPDVISKNKQLKGTPVYQFDLNGNYIARHESIREAGRAINRSCRRIQMMLNGKEKTVNQVGGYTFSTNYVLNKQ